MKKKIEKNRLIGAIDEFLKPAINTISLQVRRYKCDQGTLSSRIKKIIYGGNRINLYMVQNCW